MYFLLFFIPIISVSFRIVKKNREERGYFDQKSRENTPKKPEIGFVSYFLSKETHKILHKCPLFTIDIRAIFL